MSLDIFDSKQIAISCTSLDADHLSITGATTIGGNLDVSGNLDISGSMNVKGNLDVDGFLFFDTISDFTAVSHSKDAGNQSLRTEMFNSAKDYVIDQFYTVGDIIKLTLGVGVPLIQVSNLHFICINDTSGNPDFTSTDWTYIGAIFSDTQVYPATVTKIIHNGAYYNALSASPAGAFNAANWTLTGLANSNVGDNIIFNQTIDSSGSSITLGRNIKDHEGMLKLVAQNQAVSEIQSLTGNFILNKPILSTAAPTNFDDKVAMFYDISGDLDIIVSRPDDTSSVNGFQFTQHTILPSHNTLLMALTQLVITESVGPPTIIKRYGIVNTNIVNTGGLNLSPATVAVGYETCGTSTLVPVVGGSVSQAIVITKACGVNSKIFLSLTSIQNQGTLIIKTKTNTSFIVESNQHNDTSTFDWMLINPDYTS